MEKTTWKIGELAKQTGITVRTLHHYHQIGLLVPSEFTESGHRLYTKSEIARLQQILSLKQMGLSLEEICRFIENPNYNPVLVIQTQLESIKEQIKLKEKLCNELERLLAFLSYNKNISSDQLFKIMEVIQMNEKNYLTPEHVEKMKNLQASLTDEQKLNMQNQWNSFIASLKHHTENKTPITDPSVRTLAIFWKSATERFTGNDAEIVKAGERFHADNPNNPLSFGMTPEMYKYLKTAMEKL